MITIRTRLLVPILAVPLALGAACSGTPATLTMAAGELVRATPGLTTKAKTARMALSFEIAEQEQVKVSAEGVVDLAGDSGRMAFRIDAPGQERVTMVMLMVDGVVYADMSALGAPEGKWVRLDLSELGEDNPLSFGGGIGEDPAGAMQLLRGATDVKEHAKETVRGVSTRHVSGIADLSDALKQAPADLDAEMRRIAEGMLDRLPFDVWIDDQGRIRKLVFDMDVGEALGEGPARMLMTMEMYDFGTPFSVAAPPAEDVIDIDDIEDDEPLPRGSQDDTLLQSVVVPGGFIDEKDYSGDLDLDGAAAEGSHEDLERASLESSGFVRAAVRVAWREDLLMNVVLYTFRGRSGAEDFGLKKDLQAQSAAPDAKQFTVPGVDGATGVEGVSVDSEEPYPYQQTVLVRGDQVLVISLEGESVPRAEILEITKRFARALRR